MKKPFLVVLSFSVFIHAIGQLPESKAIDSIFKDWDKVDAPGGTLGIIKEGELIYAKGYGMANLEYDIPNSSSSVFRIGSTSKQFTAASIVLLVEKGKLSLDDTLKGIFPAFPEYANNITIRHLLNHTSGIRDYLQIAYLKGLGNDDFYVDADIMEWLVQQSDLNFNPGEEYLYSNSGYWLLGQIVNKIAGANMADFAEEEIFKPLGMNHTHFHNDHTRIVKNRASGYAPGNNDDYTISMTTLDMIGDGGIFTSIEDIKKWDDAFYDSEVLDKTFWKEMTKQGVLNNGEVIDYASGLMIDEYKGLRTISHGGAFVGFRAELLRFPEERLSIAIFANRADANPTRMAFQVADILLKDKLVEPIEKVVEEVEISNPEKELELKQMVGTYEIEPGVTASITIKNDSLNVLQNWNKSTYNLVKKKGNTFGIPGEENLSFTFTDFNDDRAQTLVVLQGSRETKAERKKEIDFSKVNLNEYSGDYYSRELDATYILKIENGVLKASIQGKEPSVDCTISEIDQFAMRYGLMRFQRTNTGISGFELDSGRVKNLKFHKK